MFQLRFRRALFVLSVLLFSSPVYVIAAEPLVTTEDFARLPQFYSPKISPDGKRLAFSMTYKGEPLLVVKKLSSKDDQVKEKMVPINAGDMKFWGYEWGNNDRLIVNLRIDRNFRKSLVVLNRVASIKRDGSDPKFLIMKTNDWDFYRQNPKVFNPLENDDQHVLAVLDDMPDSFHLPKVHKVHVNSGKRELLLQNLIGAQYWLADSNGDVRIGGKTDYAGSKRNVTIFYRPTVKDSWEKLQKIDYFDHDRLLAYRFHESDPNILLVTNANLEDNEKLDKFEAELFNYDLTKREIVGEYKNQFREAAREKLEKAVPDLKVVFMSRNKDKTRYVFKAFSDLSPAKYYLVDSQENKISLLGQDYPALKNANFAAMEQVVYKARDGYEIPAFLTVPVGSKKESLPFVIYPHDGPWSHDKWGFDNYVQFMASKGYGVLQPQFRGSTGLGIEHEEAGYGQWGYTIQDDITDGVQWLIDEGIADPDRICIMGGSFGGYAAALGVAKTPDLYRCAISINGVMDFPQLIRDRSKYLFETIHRAVLNKEKDVELVSPLHQAANIKAPLLLIAGEKDAVVPVKNSRNMYKKLKRLKKDVEYIELENGEHWRTYEPHEITTFKAIETFLAKHLGEDTAL